MLRIRIERWCGRIKRNNKIREQGLFITWLDKREVLIHDIHYQSWCLCVSSSKCWRVLGSGVCEQNKTDASMIMILWFAYLFVGAERVKWNVTMILKSVSVQTFRELNICLLRWGFSNSFCWAKRSAYGDFSGCGDWVSSRVWASRKCVHYIIISRWLICNLSWVTICLLFIDHSQHSPISTGIILNADWAILALHLIIRMSFSSSFWALALTFGFF